MNKSKLLAIIAIATLTTIAGCDQPQPAPEADANPETQARTAADAQAFEPQYIGGYPTEQTAKAAFDEYDYQAATQFYIWGYVYLNSLGIEKAFASQGGDERSIYIFDQRLQSG